MRILQVTETLAVGGAETFVIRLVNALAKEHEVMLVNLHPDISKKELLSQVSDKVTVVNLHIPFKKVQRELDRIFLKFKMDVSLIGKSIVNCLSRIIREWQPDIIHSHLFTCDYYTAVANVKTGGLGKHIITNHGDYQMYEQQPTRRIWHYKRKLEFVLRHVNEVVGISDEHIKLFAALRQQYKVHFPLHKILNGYAANAKNDISREMLNISVDDFVFGMVARGIKEKGWQQLVDAFLRIAVPKSKLLLVGEGPEIERLKVQYQALDNILFAGFSANPVDYIMLFDVGVLPSLYKAESLPTVIIECLYCRKPVIATDVGEVKEMLQGEGAECLAGILLEVTDWQIDTNMLAMHLKEMYRNKARYKTLQLCAASAFRKFDMDVCLQSYIEVYQRA